MKQTYSGLLEPIKEAHPEIGYADLWSLAAVVAVKEMGMQLFERFSFVD
jgi:catalase (peroxidase I)